MTGVVCEPQLLLVSGGSIIQACLVGITQTTVCLSMNAWVYLSITAVCVTYKLCWCWPGSCGDVLQVSA